MSKTMQNPKHYTITTIFNFGYFGI